MCLHCCINDNNLGELIKTFRMKGQIGKKCSTDWYHKGSWICVEMLKNHLFCQSSTTECFEVGSGVTLFRPSIISKAILRVNGKSTNCIIRVTLNTAFDTLWLQRLGVQTTEPNLTNGALAESWILGGGPGVGFKLIYAVLCLPYQFENCTFCGAEYSKILPLFAIWQKISMPYKLSGKTKFSMASCSP